MNQVVVYLRDRREYNRPVLEIDVRRCVKRRGEVRPYSVENPFVAPSCCWIVRGCWVARDVIAFERFLEVADFQVNLKVPVAEGGISKISPSRKK